MTSLDALKAYWPERYASALANVTDVSEAQRIVWTDHGITPERFTDDLRRATEAAGSFNSSAAAEIMGR